MTDLELTNALMSAEWEHRGNDEWIFGVKVRGLVREPLGGFYCDLDLHGSPWVWVTHVAQIGFKRGSSDNLEMAANDVEKALGL